MNKLTEELAMATEAVSGGELTHLRSGGVSLVLDSRPHALPAVLHWGADLGELTVEDLTELEFASRAPLGDSRVDVPERVSVLPTPAEGWVGRPGITGSRQGGAFSPLFVLDGQRVIPSTDTIAAGRRYDLSDPAAMLSAAVEIELAHAGLIRLRATLTNRHPDEPYSLEGLTLSLPVPSGADELLDLAGRHTRERVPQRTPFTVGNRVRESRQGKPGLDSAVLLAAGTPGFGFGSGQVWALHLGWSGNQVMYAERMYNGLRVLGAGELFLPGEVTLPPGETYTSPWVYGSFGHGLNELSARFHDYLRARPGHPRTRRPVLVNTWEAVYFRQNLDTLTALARAASATGAERFVLDDGWFRHRRNDHAGLGDWYVDETVWPDGLGPLIDEVHALGMDFGLWVEPEMVNLDSDLARAHPEWILRAGGRTGIATRQQHVLDLGNGEAYDYIWQRLTSLLDTYPIAYLKWDHNRMVLEAGHGPNGVPGVRQHTLAVYRLLDALRTRYPGLEIESCAGGGGRIDLGILERTDRVWASDCIDALERQQIQRYTQLLLPPELIGTHIGSPTAHTTHRTHNMGLRGGTAIWGHMGIEWDLTRATDADRGAVAAWIALHKELRELLHSGRVVVADHPDPAIWINGVVSTDARDAVFGIVTVDRSLTWPPGRVKLPGLDPDLRYFIAPLYPADFYPEATQIPEWWGKGVRLSGRALAQSGVQIPAMFPEYLHLIRATAEAEGP